MTRKGEWAVPTDIAAAATDVDVATEPSMVYGFSLRNAGAAATLVYIRNDAGDNTGDIVAVVELAATGSRDAALTVSFARPVRCPDGVRLERDGTNNVEGSVWLEDD